MILKSLFTLLLICFSGLFLSFDQPPPESPSSAPFVVVLDAGHGGHDPGNLGNGYMEKNIALNIVLEVGRLLEKQKDIKVVYTRKDDSFVDLYMRGKIANDANADLFVSVHCDSHSSDAHGAGTFVLGLHANEQNFEIAKKENSVIYLEDDYESRYAEYDINSPESIIGLTIMQEEFLDQSILLAKLMQDEFSGKLKRNDRKVKQAGFIVLHQTFMPSVLVETGFLTNKNEGSYLNSNRGQLEMGKAIADAILSYKENVRSQPLSNLAASPQIVAGRTDTGLPEKTADVAVKSQEPGPAADTPAASQTTPPDQAESNTTAQFPSPGSENPAASESLKPTPDTPLSGERPVTGNQESQSPDNQAVREADTEIAEIASENPAPGAVVFKVQLLASSQNIPLTSADFNGLGRLSKEPYKNLYRYLYGNTGSYSEAKILKANADQKGFPSSFIVAYRDGVRIPVPEALKYATRE